MNGSMQLLLGERSNQVSIAVFYYNIYNKVPYTLSESCTNEDITTLEKLSPFVNANAEMNGYFLDQQLYTMAQTKWPVSLETLGVTICMMFFAPFYARGQYPLYVNALRCVRELELIEAYLYSFTQVNLPSNLATHSVYGMKNQNMKSKAGLEFLSRETLFNMTDYMKSRTCTIPNFISYVVKFPLPIIETFYMFTSITKNCSAIKQCYESRRKKVLLYTPTKPIRTAVFQCCLWFECPKKAIWFIYFDGFFSFSAMVNTELIKRMEVFKQLDNDCIVKGFISDNGIYPVSVSNPTTSGDWSYFLQKVRDLNLNCIYNSPPLVRISKNIYFVKPNDATLYKYDPDYIDGEENGNATHGSSTRRRIEDLEDVEVSDNYDPFISMKTKRIRSEK